MKPKDKEPMLIELPSEDRLNLKNIEYLFADYKTDTAYLIELKQFQKHPDNNDFINELAEYVELYVTSNDNIELGSYYIAPGPKTVKYGLQKADTERQVQIANEFNASKVIASTQELEGVVQFSDKLIDLAIKQLNNTKPKL